MSAMKNCALALSEIEMILNDLPDGQKNFILDKLVEQRLSETELNLVKAHRAGDEFNDVYDSKPLSYGSPHERQR